MRARSIFTYTLVASALALPAPAYALALGKLTVQSGLGQPLVATIDLASATREEIESLQAKVADVSLYRQNNLTFQPVLTRARISVERTPDGRAMLRVTSPTPVNEPYLDLMVDVNWASGRVVREYTFLLDPPGANTMVAVDPVAPARGATTAPAPQAEAPVARSTPAGAPGSAAATPPADGHQVRRGDTLSRIAAQYKPSDVSLEQMLVALYNANPNAFDGNNMNRLRAGAIVTIPSADVAQATQPAEATRIVRVQAADWRAYRDRVAAAAPSVDGSGTREAGGRISAAAEDRAGAAPAGGDKVVVSRNAGVGRGGAAAAEDSVARNRALAEANARIAELEKTVRDMQRALELRSSPMAQAQQAAEAAKGTPAPAPIPPLATTPSASPSAPATDTKAAPPAPAPAPVTPPAVVAEAPKAAEPAKAPEPAAESPKAPESAPAATETKAPEPVAAAPSTSATSSEAKDTVKSAPKAAPKPAPAPAPQPSMMEDILSNTPTWAMGLGALVLLGGIAGIIAARRRKTTKFEDSIISGTDIKTNTVFGSTGGGVVNTGENSLASDFSREGLGNIDTDEVDPIAEAEVYLAYGRDAQAEEILKDALKKDPQRQEIYLKLLEIHAQHNKPSAFETVASELYAVSQGQGEVWQKAVALGRQLDPSNPMFAEGGAPPAARPAPAAAPVGMAPADVATFAPDITPVKVPGKNDPMDFQLDDDISIAPTSGTSPIDGPTTIQRAGESLDFTNELRPTTGATAASALASSFAAPKPAPAPAPAPTPMEEKVESVRREVAEKFDLDFQLDDDEKPSPLSRREPVGAGVAEAPPLGGSSLTRPVAAIELDKLDLGFDPDRATFEDPTPSVLDGQWHDAATKLDLAKAYQEMGDVEGAREILQEVLHEGDDQQKSEAQALLSKLG